MGKGAFNILVVRRLFDSVLGIIARSEGSRSVLGSIVGVHPQLVAFRRHAKETFKPETLPEIPDIAREASPGTAPSEPVVLSDSD